MAAKVDSAAVQDGYSLYHHVILFDERGNWTVDKGEGIVFGQGFGGITDIEVGPDGYLYVVSIGQEKIFKIVPGDYDANTPTNLNNEDRESMQDNNNNDN
jgi:hypothetical protein